MRLIIVLATLICGVLILAFEFEAIGQDTKTDPIVDDPLPEGAIARLGTSRFRGAGQLYGIAVSRNGNFLATTNAGGTTRLWNTSTGRLRAHVNGLMFRPSGGPDRNRVNFAFSQDSRLLAILNREKGIILIETETGKVVDWKMKEPPKRGGDSIHFSPDDSVLIIVSGRELKSFSVKTGESTDNDYDPRRGAPGQLLAKMFGSSVNFYKDGNYQKERIKAEFKFVGFAFSGDERTIAGGSRNGNVALYKIPGGEHLKDLPNHGGDVTFLSLSQDGTVLATASKFHGNHVRVWKLQRGMDGSVNEVREWLPDDGHVSGISNLIFVDDKVLSTSGDNTGRLWDLSTKKELKRFEKSWKASVSSNGETLAVYGLNSGSEMKLYDLGMSDNIREIKTWEGTGSVAISPDGLQVAYLTREKQAKIRIENLSTGKLIQQLDTGTYSAYTLTFSPDNTLIAFGGTSGKLRVWEVATGKPLFETTEANNQRMAFTADSKRLVSAPKNQRDDDPAIQIWDLTTGEIHSSFGKGARLMSFATMNDNRRLIGGCYDGRIRVWDVNSGQLISTLPGHRSYVTSIALSQDNKKLASGSIDSEILIWEATKLPKAE